MLGKCTEIGNCVLNLFRLDTKCSTKVHLLKTWAPGWAHWEMAEPWGFGSHGLFGVPSRSTESGPLLFPPWSQHGSFSALLWEDFVASQVPEAMRPQWTGPSRPMNQNKLFLFIVELSQDLVMVRESRQTKYSGRATNNASQNE